MEYTTLGATGTEVSRLCFGTWRFAKESGGTVETTREEAHDLLDAAYDAGINFIDTANVYGTPSGTSERWIGEWLEGVDREEIVLASKVRGSMGDHPNAGGVSRKQVRAAIEDSLDRLGTDYLDVYYVHWWDPETPLRETLSVFDDLVREGKLHYPAMSNFAAHQVVDSLRTSERRGLERFEVIQPRYNAAYREDPAEVLEVCAAEDIAVCPYSPLEGGFLTGKYERTEDGIEGPEGSRADLGDWGDRFDERQWRVLEAVREVAEEVDATPAQVSLRWLMDEGAFTCVPIIGARAPDQLRENAGAVGVDLSADQHARIADAYGE